MLTYLFIICSITIHYVMLIPISLGPPDFTRTFNLSSQEYNSSYIEIPHGLGEYPYHVEVCVFATAYNERACYPAQGSINYASDPLKYRSVIYNYNRDTIRLWILASNESNESSASPHVTGGWGRQPGHLELELSGVEVRVWESGPSPDYSTSLYLDGCDTYKVIDHGLEEEISFLSIELEITEGVNKGFRLLPCGSGHVNATTAGIVCIHSNRAIRVFTQGSQGLLALVPSVHGTERQNITNGKLLVRIWSVSWPDPCFTSPWETILRNDTVLQYTHSIGNEGKIISIQVRINDGANSGYIMSSFGGMRSPDITGLVYYYDSENITVLLATPVGDSENNVFTLTNPWGSGINRQNSNSLQIRAVVWYADAGVCPNGGVDSIEISGLEQTQTCTQCSLHSVCDSEGNCSCDAGFSGEYCETTCDTNTGYDTNCASSCDCMSQQLCNPITGDCFPISSHTASMLLKSPHFESELFPAGKVQRMETVIALLLRDASTLNSPTINQTTLYSVLYNGVSYKANVAVQVVQIQAEGNEGLIQFVIYNNTEPLASIDSVGILNRVNRSILSLLLGFSVLNISSTQNLQLSTSYPVISRVDLWSVLSSVSVLAVEILFVILLLLCITLSECLRSQATGEKEDSLYSSHKSSKKSSSKPKSKAEQNKRSAHISFNNPYYDVIAAMDLAGDIDQDFHNPLFIQQ